MARRRESRACVVTGVAGSAVRPAVCAPVTGAALKRPTRRSLPWASWAWVDTGVTGLVGAVGWRVRPWSLDPHTRSRSARVVGTAAARPRFPHAGNCPEETLGMATIFHSTLWMVSAALPGTPAATAETIHGPRIGARCDVMDELSHSVAADPYGPLASCARTWHTMALTRGTCGVSESWTGHAASYSYVTIWLGRSVVDP